MIWPPSSPLNMQGKLGVRLRILESIDHESLTIKWINVQFTCVPSQYIWITFVMFLFLRWFMGRLTPDSWSWFVHHLPTIFAQHILLNVMILFLSKHIVLREVLNWYFVTWFVFFSWWSDNYQGKNKVMLEPI